MRESKVEGYLRKRVIEEGGAVRKVKWIGARNAPDRLVILNGMWLVETKAPGKKPNTGQKREHARLLKASAKARVEILDTLEDVDMFIERITNYGGG